MFEPHQQHLDVAGRYAGDARGLADRARALAVELLAGLDAQRVAETAASLAPMRENHLDRLASLIARATRIGLWSDREPVKPSEFRRGQK